MGNEKNRYKGPNFLTVLKLPGISYFIDLRLGQFRDIENPCNFYDFNSEDGRRRCQQANVITCKKCNTHMIVSVRMKTCGLNCVRCIAPIEPED